MLFSLWCFAMAALANNKSVDTCLQSLSGERRTERTHLTPFKAWLSADVSSTGIY